MTQHIDVFDRLVVLHVIGQRFELHVHARIKAEMPRRAFAVGVVRINRRVIQEDNLFARIALVVLIDRIDQHTRDAGTVTLRDEANAIVGGLFQKRKRLVTPEFAFLPLNCSAAN